MYYVPWVIIKARILPLPSSVQEQVDDSLNYGFDGIVVYVDKKNITPTYYAAGWHNRDNKIPANPHTLFKIASIDKLYDVVALTKLIVDGRLYLNKALTDYLPELKGRVQHADGITLKMLIQHRSGIPNYTDLYMYWATPKETDDEKLNLVLDLPANFQPDENYQYCNTNYLLLSKILDRVLGYDHFHFIKDEILKPLNLNQTFGSLDDIEIEDLMSGYYVGIDADLKTNRMGSMIATAEDVGIFIRSLNEGTLLDNEEQELYSSLYVYNHTGLIPGYQSIAKYNNKTKTVIVQFTNTTDFNGYNWSLSEIIYGRIEKIISRSNSNH